MFLWQETRLREGIVKLQPHEEPLRSELLSGKFTVLVSSHHIRAVSSKGLFMLFLISEMRLLVHKWKNTVPSFISTPVITADKSLMRFHFSFKPGYYNQVNIESVEIYLTILANFAWGCSAIGQMSLCPDTWLDAAEAGSLWFTRYLHWSSSFSCLLSSHPDISIYNPERRTQVPHFSWVIIGSLKIHYWHKYLINGKAVCWHIRKWVGWKRINQI